MLGRNGNIAYVRYDSQGRIVPGGPIISAQRPKVGFWQPVSKAIGTSVTSNSLRAFVRLDAYGRVVPSSLLLLSKAPDAADSGTSWLEINATYIPYVPTTTTTTTTIIPTTTTTTTSGGSTTTTTTTLIPISTTTTSTTSSPSTTTSSTTATPTTSTTTSTSSTSTSTTSTSTSTTSSTTTVAPTTTTTTTETPTTTTTTTLEPTTTTSTTSSTSTTSTTSTTTTLAPTTTTTTTLVYTPFSLNPNITGTSTNACTYSTYETTWTFTGPSADGYPTIGARVYSFGTFPYPLNGAWLKTANGHALQGDANGYITQDVLCPTTTTTTTSSGYTIGQAALGGIIAYILQPGDSGYVAGEQHGFVVTSSDLSSSAVLGCDGTVITGAYGEAVGTGLQNTIDFLSQCSQTGCAFDICVNYSNGGYSDWYLPSLGECDKLYDNKTIFGMIGDNYWSSTNRGPYPSAWYARNFCCPDGGPPHVSANRNSDAISTRAIRSF